MKGVLTTRLLFQDRLRLSRLTRPVLPMLFEHFHWRSFATVLSENGNSDFLQNRLIEAVRIRYVVNILLLSVKQLIPDHVKEPLQMPFFGHSIEHLTDSQSPVHISTIEHEISPVNEKFYIYIKNYFQFPGFLHALFFPAYRVDEDWKWILPSFEETASSKDLSVLKLEVTHW